MAKDGTENIFHVAYDVVKQENKETWCCFIHNLINDVGGRALAFMSDRCKDLIETLDVEAPHFDTRMCVRHMPGNSLKYAVWVAARATKLPQFECAMDDIKAMNVDIAAYLMRQDPKTRSQHGLKYYPKSDIQLNNACEKFNSCILEAMDMPILSMCERLRRKLMKMFTKKRNKMIAHEGMITSEIQKKINKMRVESIGRCQCHRDGDLYEVDSYGKTYVVNLAQRTCGCNMWEFTGIPCHHAIAWILRKRLKIDDFVDPYFHKSTYLTAYNMSIMSMPGQDQW